MKFRYLPLLLTASLALPFAACDDDDFEDPEIIPVSSFSSDASLELRVGDSKQLSIKIEPAEATAQAINWVSSDGSIAAVNGSGSVTAVKVGTATITGTTPEGKTVSCSVKVVPATIVFSLNDKPLKEKDKDDKEHVYHKNSTVLKTVEITELTPITKDYIKDKGFWPELTEEQYAVLGDTKYFAGWSTAYDGAPITSTFKKKYGDVEVEMFYEAAKQDTIFAVWKERELVDFELSSGTQWTTLNLGAAGLQQLGNLYAWGENSPKDKYTWDNYKFGTKFNLTKYCYSSDYGAKFQKFIEKKDSEGNVLKDGNGNPIMVVDPENDFPYGYFDSYGEWADDDDPAFATGYKWSVPYAVQYEELFTDANVVQRREEDFQNYKVKGWYIFKKNDNRAELKDYLTEDVYETETKEGKEEVKKDKDGNPNVKDPKDPWIFIPDGTYWAKELGGSDPNHGVAITIDETGTAKSDIERFNGYSVRAVLNK